MDFRRKWAQILAANAKRYAKAINHNQLALYFIHSRAVSFNARSRFHSAVTEFRKALDFLDSISVSKINQSSTQQLRTRLLREMAVCRAKETKNSSKAKNEILNSLDMAEAIGESHNIDDALVRCVEGFIYFDDLIKAEAYLDKLYCNWSRLDPHLKAITIKMDAKLALAQNNDNRAEEMIFKGLQWSQEHHFHHQTYHFTMLNWNIKQYHNNNRQRIIT